jgi:VRR-NUC domain
MTEQQIQSKRIKQLEQDGYYVIKLIKTNKNGIPDLVAIPPRTKVLFSEVKTPTGRLSKLQEYRIKELQSHGIRTEVYRGLTDKDMDPQKKKESDRAERILFNIEECQELLTNLYEELVDRDYGDAINNAQQMIVEMKNLIKSIGEDDF